MHFNWGHSGKFGDHPAILSKIPKMPLGLYVKEKEKVILSQSISGLPSCSLPRRAPENSERPQDCWPRYRLLPFFPLFPLPFFLFLTHGKPKPLTGDNPYEIWNAMCSPLIILDCECFWMTAHVKSAMCLPLISMWCHSKTCTRGIGLSCTRGSYLKWFENMRAMAWQISYGGSILTHVVSTWNGRFQNRIVCYHVWNDWKLGNS